MLRSAQFREPLPAHSSMPWADNERNGQQTEANGEPRQQLFLSSTTPELLRWSCSPTQGGAAAPMSPTQPTRLPLSGSSTTSPNQAQTHPGTRSAAQIMQAEMLVQHLLSGLQPEDLVWTQAQNKLHHAHEESTASFTKQSVCELELDVHVSQVWGASTRFAMLI